jgi:hypothetical protein
MSPDRPGEEVASIRHVSGWRLAVGGWRLAVGGQSVECPARVGTIASPLLVLSFTKDSAAACISSRLPASVPHTTLREACAGPADLPVPPHVSGLRQLQEGLARSAERIDVIFAAALVTSGI